MALSSPDLNVMVKAAEKAARSLNRDFGEVEQLQVSRKGPADFVTAADKRAEKVIFDELKYARPTYGFLMEEGGEVKGTAEARFIIDPLDGTTNFLHGIPQWAISIALEEKGEVTVGVVYDPIKDELFQAVKGQGAFLRRKRLRVSGRNSMDMAIIGTGAPRRALKNHEQFFKEQRAVWDTGASLRRLGAAALDLVYVAAGRYEGFWERNLNQWDVAAGLLILKEAGGFACDIDSDRNDPFQTGNVLVGNEEVYSTLKKVLRP
ncbi:MAG TPA: inositol monophosphatase family protein [Alphaproteobacteria bacterium]|jgi:myo-inositol-1(or 4)-monophosphatase|nr:inositol monophosphatase [Micavibrio sp.]MBK9563018.1 inositol monophosphatase [Micavibrio sp.]HQX27249.1 inositol monophosphatase family protein [Alphaproteobacteria bacterium]